MALFFLVPLALVASAASPPASPMAACSTLLRVVNSSQDASAVILDCIQRLPPGARLDLPPGVFTLRRQLRLEKPITISTAGVSEAFPSCAELRMRRCATILVDLNGNPNPNIMPVEVVADGITLSHLVIEGSENPKLRTDCAIPDRRPLGGGLRIRGSHFTLRKSTLRYFACYTTVEALAGLRFLTFENNHIGPNGDHRPGGVWSDGITIHDAADSVVRHNRFIDNTDVQLIFGGCRRCKIEANEFRHRGSFAGASFAELMLQAFPSTSGNYMGTVVTMNDIDCGPRRRCGYGIMIGANPWKSDEDPHYPGAMFGGSIVRNTVRNAMIGINVDAATGPLDVEANRVENSGGSTQSDCGRRNWPSVNVSPSAMRFVRGNPADQRTESVSTTSCMINRRP